MLMPTMSSQPLSLNLDFRALNESVQPMFWAALGSILVTAIAVPALEATGKVIAKKIETKGGV